MHLSERRSHPGVTAAIGAVVAMVLAAVANGLVFGLGIDSETSPRYQPSFAPSGPVIGIVWQCLFAMMGASAGLLWHRGRAAMAGPVLVLLATCLLYPLYTLGFRPGLSLIGNIVALSVLIWAAWSVWPRHRLATLLLVPTAVWIVFASAITGEIIRLNGF